MLTWLKRLRLRRALALQAQVTALGESLGPRQWSLLRDYGKCMAGPPYGGLYVSGLPAVEGNRKPPGASSLQRQQ